MTDLDRAIAAVAGVGDRAAPARLHNGRAGVMLDVTGLDGAARALLDAAVSAAMLTVPGVTEARVALSAARGGRRIVAVASGKGGVGKSTVAANLAVALARANHRVGLVDADIYGPSQPRLMAAEGFKPVAADGKLIPVATRYGVPMLSMGQLVAPDKAIAWRGPMASGALAQLIDADWGPVDLLIVDMPPGTGDVQLSIIAKHKPAGAIIVTTPQDLALIDATRAIDLFEQAGVPILGLVENMAGYACPHCGEASDPFGAGASGGAAAEASRRGVPLLARIPLAGAIRAASDAGEPPAAHDDAVGAVFAALAKDVIAALSSR